MSTSKFSTVMEMIKQAAKNILPYRFYSLIKKQFAGRQLKQWRDAGFPVPPPHIVKQRAIQEYQQKYGCQTLVETGTFMGDMVEAQRNHFKKIYSIELAQEFYIKAKKRFSSFKHITILQGDSSKVLPQIMAELNEPAIFWLDGHYSSGDTAKGDKNCPIYEELDAIFQARLLPHVILIDDARHFTGMDDYPTIEELTSFVKSRKPLYNIEVKHDLIRLTSQ